MSRNEDLSEFEDATNPLEINETRNSYEIALAEIREKEKELTKRTELLENMIRSLSTNLPSARLMEPSVSIPVDAINRPRLVSFNTQSSPSGSHPSENATNVTFSYPPSYPKSYLRDALDLVPKYDGHNIPVWQFARACKRAKESIPLVDEASFVRMLRNKLTHHAYLAVEDEIHPTVNLFLEALKRTFGPGRSANYYRGQLSIAYKKPNEHVLDYIGRIKDLKSAIIEGDQTDLGRPLSNNEIAAIESYALEAFYEGLPREYRIELRAEGYANFADACSKIIAINRRLEREDARNKNLRTARENSANSANPPRILQRESAAAPNDSTTASERKICSYCKNFGHLVHECRKRLYRENLNYHNSNNNSNFSKQPRDTNFNYSNNNVKSSTVSPQNSGNHPEAPANGTTRGLALGRPAYCVEGMQNPSTSFGETTEAYPLSNSNRTLSADQSLLCSIQEPNLA